ncbi:hypothetical protein KQH61_05960 [bacterium]|nr:hypothetical protein [bacterium]
MSYLLWQLIRDVYQNLGRSEVSTATGGSTTTLEDSKLSGQGKDDDYNDGAVIILSADGAAPEGEIKRVSDYVDNGGVFTFEDAMSAAPAAGDLYLRVDPYFTYRNIVEQANKGLTKLGEITLVDTTTLDSASGQTEYTAAVAWKRRPPLRVDIQTKTDDADNNQWKEISWWEYVPAAGGSTGLIVFDRELTADRDIRVWYRASHPRVSAYNDPINELFHPSLVVAAVLVEALTWQNARLAGSDKSLITQLNDAKTEFARIMNQFPVWSPPRRAKSRFGNAFSSGSGYHGEVGKVRQ